MNINEIAQETKYSLFALFETTLESGLSNNQVKALRQKYGSNSLPRPGRTWWYILLEQFSSSFVHLLIIAAILSFFLQNHLNGIMIGLLTLATTIMGFYQEYYAERTVLLLMHYLATKSHVRRNGKDFVIPSDQLVPGDIIFLSSGNIIPADVFFIETQGLLVDESTLSGESTPVTKSSNEAYNSKETFLTPPSIGLCGSTIVGGKAIALVVATGASTKLSTIASLGSDMDRPSMFATEISQLSRIIAILVTITLVLIYGAHLLKTGRVISSVDLSLFMIALAVSIVPQAMQAVITFALSLGARAMARKDVIVKRLASIEDLGSITVLCTDKTGTITENKLSVDSIFAPNKEKVFTHALCTREKILETDNGATYAFDSAILTYAQEATIQSLKNIKIIATYEFNAQSRSNGAIIVANNDQHICIIRGAYENILEQCTTTPGQSIAEAHEWAQHKGSEGKRTLAIASKIISTYDKNHNYLKESGFIFDGLIAFVDPIKPSAHEALQEAQKLGVAIKIITGDAPNVATHVAKQVGLITEESQVITGDEFEKLSPQDQEFACKNIVVFARTLPEQKFNIINTLKQMERVAFLGEGINDVPSLKNSLVGLVVDNASDIAKDAADIVLLKKNLLVIVDGIHEGRKIFTNTLTYFQGMLTSNFSRFYAIALASFFIDFLPMLPLQILLVNFLSDLPLVFIATDNVDPNDLEKPRHYRVRELISFGMILGGLCFCIDLIFFIKFKHADQSVLRTNWFIITVLTEHIFFYLIRAKECALFVVQPSTILTTLTIISMGLTIALPYTSIGKSIFEFTPPTTEHLIWMSGFLGVYFIIMEMCKLMYYRYVHKIGE